MADGDQRTYWFPYWSRQPQPPPASRPPMLRRPSAAPVAPSPPRQPPSQHHRQPSRGRAAPPPPPSPAQAPRPSPSRASPLTPIRVPPPPPPPTSNSNAGAAAPPKPISGPVSAREAAPKLKDVDVVVPQEKSVVQQPATEIKPPHGNKATDHEENKAPVDKQETKSKEKVKEKEKEKEKEKKEEKENEKEKQKKKEEKEKKKEEKKHHVVGDDGSKHKEIMEDSPSPGKKRGQGEQGKLHTEIKAGVADMVHQASSGGSGGHERAAGSSSVITLAGENKGASMKVGGPGPPGKEGVHWHGHGRRLDGNDDREAAAGEGRGGKQGTMRALVNSNVQVINNSLMFQSSCSNGDPGVHLKLSAKSKSKDQQRQAGDIGAKK